MEKRNDMVISTSLVEDVVGVWVERKKKQLDSMDFTPLWFFYVGVILDGWAGLQVFNSGPRANWILMIVSREIF
jgi:hypothetical protein